MFDTDERYHGRRANLPSAHGFGVHLCSSVSILVCLLLGACAGSPDQAAEVLPPAASESAPEASDSRLPPEAWRGPGQCAGGRCCATRDALRDKLARAYGEAPLVSLIDGAGRHLQLVVNRRKGSWSLLVTWPNGITCMTASGPRHAIYPLAREGESGT